MKKIVVFASGSGTNFQSIIDAVEAGNLPAKISGLITNKSSIRAIDRAKNHGIPIKVIKRSDYEDEKAYTKELLNILKKWSPDLIVLAGYLQKIPDVIISTFPGRIINIHPSLLPKYGGKGYFGIHVHEAVLANKEKESGCTVHVINEEYDDGQILDQIKVPVYPSDSPSDLQQRILKKEHKLLVKVIKELITQK